MTNIIRKGMSMVEGHWHKGSYADGEGNYCGIGAVRVSATDDEWGTEANRAVTIMTAIAREQFPERCDAGMGSFAAFNDHPDTTEEEVLRVMDKAAVELDSRVDFASGV